MRKFKLIYQEFLEDTLIQSYKRICRVEKTTNELYEINYVLEKKEQMNLLVSKNNDIITIKREGVINYEIEHQAKKDVVIDIVIRNFQSENKLSQQIHTFEVSKEITEKEAIFTIIYETENGIVKNIYKIVGGL